MTPQAATRTLRVVLGAVAVYAASMIVLGVQVNALFGVLGFGAEDYGIAPGEQRRYVVLLQGVLGAVILGWVLLLDAVVRRGLARDPDGPWWAAVVTSTACWFVVDTGFSLVLGQWPHALFNLVFATALALPLVSLRPGGSGRASRAGGRGPEDDVPFDRRGRPPRA